MSPDAIDDTSAAHSACDATTDRNPLVVEPFPVSAVVPCDVVQVRKKELERPFGALHVLHPDCHHDLAAVVPLEDGDPVGVGLGLPQAPSGEEGRMAGWGRGGISGGAGPRKK